MSGEQAADPGDQEFGLAGWVLVGAIVLTLVIVPIVILLLPQNIGYRLALVILPLVPAGALAVIAVWAALRG